MSEASAAYEQGHMRVSRREASLGIVALLSIGGFLAQLVPHSGEANAALVQQVSANTADIKTAKDDRTQDKTEAQAFRREVLQRLDALDGRSIDMYHVMLQLQQDLDEKGARR